MGIIIRGEGGNVKGIAIFLVANNPEECDISRAFPNCEKWGKLIPDEASSLIKEISS